MKTLLLKSFSITCLFVLVVFGLPKLSPIFASSLLLNPPYGSIEAGKDLNVDVVLKGNDEVVDGVDVSISYDADVLKVKEIKNGGFFNNYPTKTYENGKILVTALAPKDGVKISGDIVVASIDFEILDSGSTNLTLNFQKDSTKDSNVTVHNTAADSLLEVKNGSYTVVATAENLQAARVKKAQKFLPLLPFFLLILMLIGGGVWYYMKHRKPPKEDVFIPEEFPLDRPPKLE